MILYCCMYIYIHIYISLSASTTIAYRIGPQLVVEHDPDVITLIASSHNNRDTSKKEGAFLTGVSLDTGLATYDHPSSEVNLSLGDDQRFYQAIDEVERIRQVPLSLLPPLPPLHFYPDYYVNAVIIALVLHLTTTATTTTLQSRSLRKCCNY